MSMTINTNLNSLTAQRNTSRVQNDLATAIGRLSSGMRINSAKDDAAGLAISERFTTQIRGLNQAARNANDGISMAQTAEGALSSVSDNLQRIRELAVQSANSTNSASDRAAMQTEASQLMSEVQRVGTQTNFNGVNLLDGSFSNKSFQVGANAGQTIAIGSIVDARTSSLGSNTLGTTGSKISTTLAAQAGAYASNGVLAETTLKLSNTGGTTAAIGWAAGADAKGVAAAINTAGASIGVSATATSAATLKGLSATGALTFTLGGQAITANVTSTTDLTALANAINGQSSNTGVTASFSSSSAKDSLTLTTADGRDINIGAFTGANVSVGNYDAATNATTNLTTLTSGGTNSTIVTGKVDVTSTKGALSYSAATNTDVFNAAAGAGTFTSLSTVDLSSAGGATSALSILDAALAQVNAGRADLGAVQNRFSATISNLQTSSENMSASRSRIQDADFASETANLSRAQVLQQAGTAMIAQANQQPQQVLALLR